MKRADGTTVYRSERAVRQDGYVEEKQADLIRSCK